MTTEAGACEVYRQPDGWWRWRWVPVHEEAEPLFSAHTFESEEDAMRSAKAAFPGGAPTSLEPTETRSDRRARRKRRFKSLTLVAVLAILLARRRGAARRDQVSEE